MDAWLIAIGCSIGMVIMIPVSIYAYWLYMKRSNEYAQDVQPRGRKRKDSF